MKKVLLLMAIAVIMLFSSCGKEKSKKSESEVASTTTSDTSSEKDYDLWIVTASGEMEKVVSDFNEQFPNVKVQIQIIPYRNYLQMILPMIRENVTPDIITINEAGKFMNKGLFVDILKDKNIKYNPDEYYSYITKYATNKKGELEGVINQSTPGAYFYRASLMKKVIGTDDPSEVSKYTNNLKGFMELAQKAKEKGLYMMGDSMVAVKMFLNANPDPFVDDNKNVNLKGVRALYEWGKEMVDKEYDAELGWHTPQYATEINGDKVLGFFYPTWGVIPMTRMAKESVGDWRVAEPPFNFFFGGFLTVILKTAQNKSNAEKFVNFFISEEYLTKHSKEVGDFVSNIKANEKNMDMTVKLFGPQKINKVYDKLAKRSILKKSSLYDTAVIDAISQTYDAYVQTNTYATVDDAIKGVVERINMAEPDLKWSGVE